MRKEDLEKYEREQSIIRRLKEAAAREREKELHRLYPWRRPRLPTPGNSMIVD